MSTYSDVNTYNSPSSLGTSPTTYPFTAGSNYTFPVPVRFLRASVAGNITYTDYAGVNKVAAFAAGETRALGATAIINTGTTATGIEGMP